jgi:hypothetical protein
MRSKPPQSGAKKNDPKIWMILCPSYHGATLLSLVIGNHSRVLALGDTIPPDALSHVCGCGELVANCEFWQRVGTVAGSGDPHVELVYSRPRISSRPALNTTVVIAAGLVAARLGVTSWRGKFAQANEQFLQMCSESYEFDIFIDGYKSLSRYLALKASGFSIAGVIHLVRDPLSFVASAKRNRQPVKKSARQWSQLHKAITSVTRWTGERVIQIRYEDFCADPDCELRRLQSWMGVREEVVQRPIEKGVHWIGNSSMRDFDGHIRCASDWLTTLTVDERRVVQKITSKRAREFGYL